MADKSVVFVIKRKEEQSRTSSPSKKSKLPQTGNAPIRTADSNRSGGIFGRADPEVKGFQGRKGIRGGVARSRDDRSKAAVQQEKFNDKISRMERQLKQNTVSSAAVEKIIKDHMEKFVHGSQLLSNPQGFMGANLPKLLGGAGPHGAAIVAAITAIVTAPEVAATIIRVLSQKGLPLNDDWRRMIEDEVNSLFNMEEKKRRLLGLDAYAVTQTDRYQPDSGSSTYNSLENRDEAIISKIGLAEKSVGVE